MIRRISIVTINWMNTRYHFYTVVVSMIRDGIGCIGEDRKEGGQVGNPLIKA